MSLNFTFYFLNNLETSEIDVTEDVDLKSVKIIKRDDLSLERGSFTMYTNKITYNIPPYTLLEINGVQYMATSQATKYLTVTDKYVHNVTLYSTEAILETFTLGSKAFSNDTYYDTDYKKLGAVLDLMNSKYNGCYSFLPDTTPTSPFSQYGNALSDVFQYTMNEYTFGTGTTLLAAFRTMMNQNSNSNLKMRLSCDVNIYANVVEILVKIQYKMLSTSPVVLDNSRILSANLFQNNDNYCKYIETEAQNVIDRANPITYYDLSVRSEEIITTTNNCCLILPTNVEGITKFEVNGSYNYYPSIYLPNIISISLIVNTLGGSLSGSRYIVRKTYQEYINANISYGNITNIFKYFYDNVFKNPDILSTTWEMSITTTSQNPTMALYNALFYTSNGTVDYISYCVEENDFNALPLNEQSQYVFYKTGTNVIKNLNASYRTSFWDEILGYSAYNFLEETEFTTQSNLDTNNYATLKTKANGTDAEDKTYNIQAVPIISPKVIDVKNSLTPVNELMQKYMTRTYSYGNDNGLPADFKALINDMDLQNEQLGLIEGVVEYDVTDLTALSTPSVAGQVSLTWKTSTASMGFYVIATETRFVLDREIRTLFLAKNPTKIADAIGVSYQFNSTTFPLENIITRPIYQEIIDSAIYNAINTNGYDINRTLVKIEFLNRSNTIEHIYIKRPDIYKINGKFYFYFECLDNYSFDKTSDSVVSSGRTCSDCPYGNSLGEVEKIKIHIMKYNSGTISLSDSYKFPYTNAIANVSYIDYYETIPYLTIKKDPREKLTFTLVLKNS